MSWFEKSTVYQVYPLGLTGAPHAQDNIVVPRISQLITNGWIEHFKRLGVGCLLLNPVVASSTHGYDTIDLFTIDPRLGTTEDLLQVIEACHAAGIRVLLDAVFNHVGRDFWAFCDVREKRDKSAYADWFYLDWSGNSAFDDGFGYQCWEGVGELVRLNHGCGGLVEHLCDAFRSWVRELGIDGLRLDVAYCLDRGFLYSLRCVAEELSAEVGRDIVLVGETLHGDYNQWMGEHACHSVTNYECYKGLWSSFNEANLHEIAYSLNRQFGSDPWCLYTGRHLLSFVDNHDVPRIATQLTNKQHLVPAFGLLFGMPGVPCVYYGSEWGTPGEKLPGDHELRPSFAAPEWTELSDVVAQLSLARMSSEALVWGSYQQLAVAPQQLVFARASEHERVIVAINAAAEPTFVGFDAGCARGTSLLSTGEEQAFEGGAQLPVYSVSMWRCL